MRCISGLSHGGLVLACMMVTAISACNQPERLGNQPAIDPRRSVPNAHYEEITLNPMVLVTHADYDRWESQVKARGGSKLVYTLYREAMLRQRGDQRTFVRWIVAALDPELDDQYRQGLQPFIRSLMNAPELGEDARYLFGALAWYQLRHDPLGADAPRTQMQRNLIETVQTNWEQLVKDSPKWRGPHGVTASDLQNKLNALTRTVVPPQAGAAATPSQHTFGTEIVRRIDRAYEKANRSPPWKQKASEAQAALQGFYQEYEEHGAKRACQRVDQAMKLVQDPTAIGDAYAHCALHRNNPFSALDQVRRMVLDRRTGGLNLVLNRLTAIARVNEELAIELDALRQLLKEVHDTDPEYAKRTGLSEWITSAAKS